MSRVLWAGVISAWVSLAAIFWSLVLPPPTTSTPTTSTPTTSARSSDWFVARLHAQSACTPTAQLGLCKGARGSLDWDLFLNTNFDLIDATVLNTLGGSQTKSGTLAVGGLALTPFTVGAIPFVSTGGFLAEAPSAFVWDAGNARLGVGTASPTFPLDVVGTARVTGLRLPTGASSGHVLTSDADGVASWQAPTGGGGGGWTDGGATVHLSTASDRVSLFDTSATEKLEVGGGVRLAAASGATPAAGVIEWDGTNFRGYTGATWKNLDEAGGGGSGGGWVDGGATVTLETATDDVGVGTAAVSTTKLRVGPEANQTALDVTGGSLTGSSALPLIDLAATWNTSGVPTLVRASLTDTASGAGAKLLDLLVGGMTRFSVAKTGAIFSAAGLTLDYETTTTTGEGITFYRGNATTPRTDAWTQANVAGLFEFRKVGEGNPSLRLHGSGVASLISATPSLIFDGTGVDWTLQQGSDRLGVFSGPYGSATERVRFAADALTLYVPLTLTAHIGSHLTPTASDTYDIGSPARLWNAAFISQLNAVVFAEQTLTLLGGWFSVSPDQGTFAAIVASDATSINFGKAMTVGHFVEVRGYDTAGVLRTEYLQVGSLVGGTTYNVTRGLNGTSATWASGTPFRVNGTSGSGRVELNAYDTPRISLVLQGATYNAQTETVRIGDLNGMPGVSSTAYGIYLGDATQYLKYTGGVLTIAGNGAGLTSISGGNIQTGTVTATQLNVATLSAISANLGTVTAGTLTGVTITTGQSTLDTSGLRVAAGTAFANDRAFRFTSADSGDHGVYGAYDTSLGNAKDLTLRASTAVNNSSARVYMEAFGRTSAGVGTTTSLELLGGNLAASSAANLSGQNHVSISGGSYVLLTASGGTLRLRQGGNENTEVYVAGRTGLTGSAVGSAVYVDRSTGTTNVPGMFLAIEADGGFAFLWPDSSGIWRTGSAAPEADGTPAHDSGTVVGSQTSHRAAKESIRDWVDYDVSLALIRATPLYQFRYRDGRFQRQWFTGLITDTAPAAFGMDEGRALNEVSAIGHLFGSVRALADRVEAAERRADGAEARVEALTRRLEALEARLAAYTARE